MLSVVLMRSSRAACSAVMMPITSSDHTFQRIVTKPAAQEVIAPAGRERRPFNSCSSHQCVSSVCLTKVKRFCSNQEINFNLYGSFVHYLLSRFFFYNITFTACTNGAGYLNCYLCSLQLIKGPLRMTKHEVTAKQNKKFNEQSTSFSQLT